MDCIFCKIISGEIPGKVLYEDDKVIVFLDINPNVDGHTLIVPKKHYTDFTELDDDIILHMNKVKNEMVKFLMKKLDVNACTISMNYGDSQIVKHVHMHILPNFINEMNPKRTIDEVFKILKSED